MFVVHFEEHFGCTFWLACCLHLPALKRKRNRFASKINCIYNPEIATYITTTNSRCLINALCLDVTVDM